MNIEVIKKKSVPILRKYGIQSAAIFGSAARGEDGPDSDIDFLVRLGNQMGVYKFIGLKYDLQEALGKNVDLVSDRAINKYIKPYIEKDLTLIYER
ncbi:MAG: nucleotidyltransferase family protein [Patescibacteria group bacterium]